MAFVHYDFHKRCFRNHGSWVYGCPQFAFLSTCCRGHAHNLPFLIHVVWGHADRSDSADTVTGCLELLMILSYCGVYRPHDTIYPLNIANIRYIDLLPCYPPQYLLTPFNIYEFLLTPLISTNPPLPSTHSYYPLNIN